MEQTVFTFFIREKWRFFIFFFFFTVSPLSIFAVDNLIISGITGTYSSVNGTYLPYTTITDGTPSKTYNVWKLVNGSNTYYIFHDNDNYCYIAMDYTNYNSLTFLFYMGYILISRNNYKTLNFKSL